MGVILDSSVLIDFDRRSLDVEQMLEALKLPEAEIVAISAVTLMEFATGVALADSDVRRARRKQFLEDLQWQLPVLPFDSDLAVRTGELNGDLRKGGITVGSIDLMIGVTALVVGYSVVTRNVRHFRIIPGLDVVEV